MDLLPEVDPGRPAAGEEQQQPPQEEEDEATPAEGALSRRQSMDMALLSRHIDHMQRICQASLSDLTMARHRRQVIRLQSIRRMLEDLQRQIRQLRSGPAPTAGAGARETDPPPPPPLPSSYAGGGEGRAPPGRGPVT